MYCSYQNRQALEDDLYRGDGEESEGSEAFSELEFHLYSQLHYPSNTGDLELPDGEDQPSQEIHAADKAAETAVNVKLEDSTKTRPRSSKTVKLEQQCNNKSEKQVNQKKKKSGPKVQRPLPGFEEIIVIDSDSEVITISESHSSTYDDDDDVGVCALKGGSVHRVKSSIPAVKVAAEMTSVPTPHKKVINITPVTLDSSSSESSNSCNSDSDVLENWMILGQAKQEGDYFISLNVEGIADSIADVEEDNDDSSWVVLDKDREAQIFNKDKRGRTPTFRLSNRYYTDKNVNCRNCDKMGHLSKNCPEPTKLPVCYLCGDPNHMSSRCPNKHCNNCGLPGHLYECCSEMHFYHKKCHRCGMTGHFFDACPEIWRQYHISTKTGTPLRQEGEDKGRSPAYCYNCSKKGHFGHRCTQQRMSRGSFATTPFINFYDTMTDIKSRQHRLKGKVEALKRNGLMPDKSQTWLSPPKKKQKISHASNGHLFNKKIDRNVYHHKASTSHISFHDRNDSPKSKFNKHRQQESAGKQWKPKRAVPKERPASRRLIADEAMDFPRGGGGREKTEKKKKKKNSKSKNNNRASSVNDSLILRTPPSKSKKDKHEKKNHLNKQKAAQTSPTDENLFKIKQRKHKR
ncbi:zinc finger CCHC domain-containing protein 7 [Vanacampus margaritifer]